jgi:hypothetical protein
MFAKFSQRRYYHDEKNDVRENEKAPRRSELLPVK